MAETYKALGINLKAMPMGESDRLVTVLTREFGLIRAVAPGSRKHDSTLRGRSGVFAVNRLLIVKGRTLDKIVQADGVEFYGGLSQDLRRLTASQYLAELALFQALSDQPQEQLFDSLQTHLRRLETVPSTSVLPYLTHAAYHLLEIAGFAPRVHHCCLTQQPLIPDFSHQDWRVGFSASAGGVISEIAPSEFHASPASFSPSQRDSASPRPKTAERTATYPSSTQRQRIREQIALMTARELSLMQHLSSSEVVHESGTLQLPAHLDGTIEPSDPVWLSLERMLRQYAQFHFERPIRSASLIDTCFSH